MPIGKNATAPGPNRGQAKGASCPFFGSTIGPRLGGPHEGPILAGFRTQYPEIDSFFQPFLGFSEDFLKDSFFSGGGWAWAETKSMAVVSFFRYTVLL